MTIVQGMFNTSGFTTDHAKKSFAGMILRYMPNGQAPLFALTSMLKTETAVQIEHGYFSKTMLFPMAQLNGAIANGTATTFTVDSSAQLLPGMLLRVNTTGENVLVVTVDSGTQITVARGIGTVAAAAIADDVKLYQIGNASEEGSAAPTAMNIQPVRITNLTQIFRNSWALTDTVRQTMMIAGEGNVAESKMDAAAFHAADIEKGLIFGQKSSGTRNGKPFRTMDGLISIVGNLTYYPSSYASANVFTAGSTTNWTQLEAMLDATLNQNTDPKGGNERMILLGGTALRVINNICRLNADYKIIQSETTWGLRFSTLQTARGTFRLVEHPLFNTNADWSKMALVVDLATFNVAYLGDRKTKTEDTVVGGVDGLGGVLTTELTTVVKNPPANAVIYNLTAAAAG
jgi:hypothetical protein